MNITLAIAVIGLIAAVFNVWYTTHLNRNRLIEKENREIRRKVYLQFYLSLIGMTDPERRKSFEIQFDTIYNSLLFYAPDELLNALVEWRKHIAKTKTAQFDDPKFKRILDLMRKDLGISREGIISTLTLEPLAKINGTNTHMN